MPLGPQDGTRSHGTSTVPMVGNNTMQVQTSNQGSQPALAAAAAASRPDMRASLDSGPRSFPLTDSPESHSAPGAQAVTAKSLSSSGYGHLNKQSNVTAVFSRELMRYLQAQCRQNPWHLRHGKRLGLSCSRVCCL